MADERTPRIPAEGTVSTIDEIAEYADSHDFSAEMENGTWHPGGDRDPDSSA
jgi:hypothetical protein